MIFDQIYIDRTVSGSTTPSQKIKVPLSYAPKKKILLRFEQDPNIDRPSAITLPRMSFAITGYEYDSERNLPNLNKFSFINYDDANKMKYTYVASPINIIFELYIYTKNTEDMMKIFEQFIPFFKPEWTSSVQLIPELGITHDIPIEMRSNSIEDAYTGTFTERQYLLYTFQFIMRAYYYGPAYDKKIIKFVDTNFYMGTSVAGNTMLGDYIGKVNVQPGLTANGEPTSNTELSIDPNEIYVSDDYGFIIETESPQIIISED